MRRCLALLAVLLASACAPTSSEQAPNGLDKAAMEKFVAQEASDMLAVTEDNAKANTYRFTVFDPTAQRGEGFWPERDLAAYAARNHQIFLTQNLVVRAYEAVQALRSLGRPGDQLDRTAWNLWVFRLTLAHEIAHTVLRHPEGGKVSWQRRDEIELEADAKAIEYWRRRGWGCSFWLGYYREFSSVREILLQQKLAQVERLCPA